MLNKQIIILVSIALVSCATKKLERVATSNYDIFQSASIFAMNILKENLRVQYHERVNINYLDIQMIFETDNFVTDNLISYTSYSNKLYQDSSSQSHYGGSILFVATYNNSANAEFAFSELKSNTQIRISELEGFAGLLVEQVQVFEKIRKFGGMLTQKNKYIFYLLETCEDPPVKKNWSEYEYLFLESITDKNEVIEVINADCDKDIFLVEHRRMRK